MAGEDPDYIHWLHSQECAAQPCAETVVEANHSTVGRGKSQRTHDREAFPLCKWKHHPQFTGARSDKGFFRGWSRDQIRDWQRAMSQKYRTKYEAELAEGKVATAHPDDRNLPRNARRSGVIDLLERARTLCRENSVPPQVELLFVRLVREAADWGIR